MKKTIDSLLNEMQPSLSSSHSSLSIVEKPTVLVVDDELGVLDTYQNYLSPLEDADIVQSARRKMVSSTPAQKTYRVLLAQTGEQAISLVEKEAANDNPIQLGFFDMKMPGGIDGLETIRRIREIDTAIHCVIVTAYQDRSLDEIGKVFGPEAVDQWEYLNKPFTANEIIQKTRNAVALWKRRRQHEELVKTMEESNVKFKQFFEKQMLNLALENKELKEKTKQLEEQIKSLATQKS